MLVLSLLLSISAAAPVKLAAPGFNHVGIDDKRGDAYLEFLAEELRRSGLSVTTRSQIAAVIGLERQKALLGCSEESATCLAELAGALGVDGVITGTLNRTRRGSFVVTITVAGASDGRTLASGSTRAGDEDALYDFFTRFAAEEGARIVAALAPRAAPTPPPETTVQRAPPSTVTPPARATALTPPPPAPRPSRPSGPPHPGWFVAGAGAASLIAGGVVYALASARHGELRQGGVTFSDRTALEDELGQLGGMQVTAAVLAAVGVAAAGAGTTWALLPRPGIAFEARGTAVTFAWELP